MKFSRWRLSLAGVITVTWLVASRQWPGLQCIDSLTEPPYLGQELPYIRDDLNLAYI